MLGRIELLNSSSRSIKAHVDVWTIIPDNPPQGFLPGVTMGYELDFYFLDGNGVRALCLQLEISEPSKTGALRTQVSLFSHPPRCGDVIEP